MGRAIAVALCASALALGGCGSGGVPGTTTQTSPTTTQTSPPAPTTTTTVPFALWIGDSYTAGAGGTSSATSEAEEASGMLGWHAAVDAEGGTGFVANGHAANPSYEALPTRLVNDETTDPDPDVVVLDAGRNDHGVAPSKLRRTVVSYFDALAEAYPSSAVVVIAPYLMTSKPTDYLLQRRLLKQQAEAHGWAFVDPIGEGWIDPTSAKLVASDGVHPDQAGQNYIADHLLSAIPKALAAAGEKVR